MPSIIDNPLELVNLSKEELDEALLDEKYNKPMLRELIRQLIGVIHTQKKSLIHHIEHAEKSKNKIEKIASILFEGEGGQDESN